MNDYSAYYAYLIGLLNPPAETPLHRYSQLLYALWRREFFWLDRYESEENRAADGRQLRDQYIIDFDCTPNMVPQGPCTVLEMLIAFALRMDQVTFDWRLGHKPYEWLEMFIDNLGLAPLTDGVISSRDESYIDARLETWCAHNIGTQGEGGLFRYRKPILTISNLSNWDQMQQFICENFK